jgi:alpha-1,3-rhamnosyltransferase
MDLNNKPLVTVGMPAYNHGNYIKEAIISTIEQTYDNIEFIIINDGSKDNTDKVIRSLENKCKSRFINFMYINQENRGISYTLNKILNMAKGEYITFISSDDTHKKERVEEKVKFFLTHPSYDICYSGYNQVDNQGNILRVINVQNSFEPDFEDILFRKTDTSYIEYMARTDVLKEIGGFIDGIKIEDVELALRVKYHNKKVIYLNKSLYNYRQHENNTVKRLQYMKDGRFEIIEMYKNHPKYEEALAYWQVKYKKRDYQEFINKAYKRIILYNDPLYKIVIYGTGAFGKIIEALIPNSNYCFVDQASKKTFDKFKKGETYSKDSLKKMHFDYLFISPLWLDVKIKNELLNEYNIDSNKIIQFESSELL